MTAATRAAARREFRKKIKCRHLANTCVQETPSEDTETTDPSCITPKRSHNHPQTQKASVSFPRLSAQGQVARTSVHVGGAEGRHTLHTDSTANVHLTYFNSVAYSARPLPPEVIGYAASRVKVSSTAGTMLVCTSTDRLLSHHGCAAASAAITSCRRGCVDSSASCTAVRA